MDAQSEAGQGIQKVAFSLTSGFAVQAALS